MQGYPRGTTILIEATLKKVEPFASANLADPSNGVFITIYAPNGEAVVDAQPMSKSDTGKYYYAWQTDLSLQLGTYEVMIKADDSQFDGVLRLQFLKLVQ